MEVARTQLDQPEWRGRTAARDAVTGGKDRDVTAVHRAHGLARSPTTKSSSSWAASTSVRSKSMCGEIGVSNRQRNAGEAIGPRTENEYAVEPVGVATMTPSAA